MTCREPVIYCMYKHFSASVNCVKVKPHVPGEISFRCVSALFLFPYKKKKKTGQVKQDSIPVPQRIMKIAGVTKSPDGHFS